MKKRIINVNLWDDYKQKPYHDQTDQTTLTIETLDGLKDSEILLLRQIIITRCLIWKETEKLRDVCFTEGEKDCRILIDELDYDKRHSLYDYLRKDKSAFGDIEIQWLMES